MKIFTEYFRTHIKSLILLAIFFISFSVVMMVFNVNTMVILYGTVICIFVGFIMAYADFGRYRKKHELLNYLKSEVTDTIDNMPVPKDLIEEDYQSVIKCLFEEKRHLDYEKSRRYEEMCEYYTIWAHQIKTPIAAMRLILQSGSKNLPEHRELSDELFKIEQYVEMVLCFLRLDGDGSDYLIKEYSLDSIVTQAVRKYSSQFIRRKNRLNFTENGKHVITDEKWLLFVVEQVLSNALKYTMDGEISIYVEEPLTLVISDTGIGIAKEDLPRIFEKGFTGYNGRADKKSTGIGLYLCRRIAARIGCSISAESEQGKGTKIKIDLNLTKV